MKLIGSLPCSRIYLLECCAVSDKGLLGDHTLHQVSDTLVWFSLVVMGLVELTVYARCS